MLSRENTKLLEVLKEITYLKENPPNFETRDGYIVANIKCYDYLTQADVIEVCKNLNLSGKNLKKALKEFDNERLLSIEGHVRDIEVDNLLGIYQNNVDLDDVDAQLFVHTIFHWNSYTLESAVKTYPYYSYQLSKHWENSKLQDSSYKEWCNYIKGINPINWDKFYRRKSIQLDCGQLGKSGGWFSICKESNVELVALAYNLYDDFNSCESDEEFNEEFENYLVGETKEEDFLYLEKNLREYKTLVENIQYCIDSIEDSKLYFKGALFEELQYELTEYASKIKLDFNVTIQVANGLVRSSLGVTIREDIFRAAFTKLQPSIQTLTKGTKLKINQKVGVYKLEYAKKKKNDFLIKAGCHRFSFNQIKEALCI